ncbi:MAG TPA: hypothetical protein VJ001_03830 [Rhodocyclaceae bacterium]|nr:hypothetical protein [Rhodocyclaceae bacterium]
MRHHKSTPPPPAALQHALDWLALPQHDDALNDLVPLRQHLAGIRDLDLPASHRIKLAEMLQQRVDRVDRKLAPLLLDARFPLLRHLRIVAQGLIELRGQLSTLWLKIADESQPSELKHIHRPMTQICRQGVDNLAQQLTASLLVAMPMPANLWRSTLALRRIALDSLDPDATLPFEMNAFDKRFKTMLALSTAQPEGLTPREILFLADYAQCRAACIRLDTAPPSENIGWFWLDGELDQAPVALIRSNSQKSHLYLHSGELAEVAVSDLEQLNSGTPPVTLGLPMQSSGADYRNVLERASQCWAASRYRSHARRPQQLKVEVCTHLGSLWTALSSTSGADSAPENEGNSFDADTSEWIVINEGPAGYAMVHLQGTVPGFLPGFAVGLRTGSGAAWQICLVRWARNQEEGQVELGLEIIAPSALPVRIQAEKHDRAPPVPALLLPALPRLNRNEAILASRGDYNLRPFMLLEETAGRLRVVECTPQLTLVETSSVEIFEFSRDLGAV